MGWILTKPKKKSGQARKKAKPAKNSKRAADDTAARNHRTGVAAMRLFLSVTLVGLGGWGWHQAENRLANYWENGQNQVSANKKQLIIVDQPTWMSDQIQQELENAAMAHLPDALLADQSLSSVEKSLLQSAWVKQIEQIQRNPEGLLLKAVFREPVALVAEPSRRNPHYHAVDAEGVRLPASSNSLENLSNWPLIVGTHHQPGRLGEPWPGDGVWDALKLMRYLIDKPYWKQIKAIDIGMRDLTGRPLIVLATDEPERIEWPSKLTESSTAVSSMISGLKATKRRGVIWGPPPGREEPLEIRTNQKVERFKLIYDHCQGKIDRRGLIVELTALRGPQIYTVVDDETEETATQP